MARVYIDTNVFLDFYQSATDRLGVFRELVERADKVVLTEQTVKEFRRNRAARLATLSKETRRSAQVNIFTTSVVRELPQFQAMVEARNTIQALAGQMAHELDGWIANEQSDPVLREFNKLVEGSLVLSTDEEGVSGSLCTGQEGLEALGVAHE